MVVYDTARTENTSAVGGVAVSGLLGGEAKAKQEAKDRAAARKAKSKKKSSPRKKKEGKSRRSPSKSALEAALGAFDERNPTPDLAAKQAIKAAEEFLRCQSVPEGLVDAKAGLAGALPALASKHASLGEAGVLLRHASWGGAPSAGSSTLPTPGGMFGSFESLELSTPAELALESEYRQELVAAGDRSATKTMRGHVRRHGEQEKSSPGRHSLSPLKADPKLAAQNTAANASAAATAHPWRGATPELDGWNKPPYVPHATEVRIATPPELKSADPGRTSIPLEFQVTEDDPIFPTLEAEMLVRPQRVGCFGICFVCVVW